MLPIFQTDDQDLSLVQTKWAAELNPLLAKPLSGAVLIKNVVLASGTNQVNHLLQRKLQGWFPVRFHGAWAEIYDTQDTNQMPQLTLNLTSSAAVTIDLMVF